MLNYLLVYKLVCEMLVAHAGGSSGNADIVSLGRAQCKDQWAIAKETLFGRPSLNARAAHKRGCNYSLTQCRRPP